MSNLRRLRRSVAKAAPFNELVGDIPGLDTSRVGRINAYKCDDCGGYTVTRDIDAGVTPMFLACRATERCYGRAASLGYPSGPVPEWLPPVSWEWYRPVKGDPILRDPAMLDHIARGGLALRPGPRPRATVWVAPVGTPMPT